MREPIFGPNAKPFFIQLAFGILLMKTLLWIGVGDFFYDLPCYVITCSQ